MKRFVKGLGSVALWIVIVLALGLLIGLFVRGSLWASQFVLPWLFRASGVALLVLLFGLLPLSFIRKVRPLVSTGLIIISWLFGLTIWFWSLILAYAFWGVPAIVIGLLLAGLGVVPIAILASLFNGQWGTAGFVLIGSGITYAIRLLSVYLLSRSTEEPVTMAEVLD